MKHLDRLASNIKTARAAAKLTQADAAAACSASIRVYQKWEGAEREPSASNLALIANALGTTTDALMEGVIDMEMIMIYTTTVTKAYEMAATDTHYTYEPYYSDSPDFGGYSYNGEAYYLPVGYTVDQMPDGSPCARDTDDHACDLVDHYGQPALVSPQGIRILNRANLPDQYLSVDFAIGAGDNFVEKFDTLEAANIHAEDAWTRMSDYDKGHREVYVAKTRHLDIYNTDAYEAIDFVFESKDFATLSSLKPNFKVDGQNVYRLKETGDGEIYTTANRQHIFLCVRGIWDGEPIETTKLYQYEGNDRKWPGWLPHDKWTEIASWTTPFDYDRSEYDWMGYESVLQHYIESHIKDQ